jgi:hypothetical protein
MNAVAERKHKPGRSNFLRMMIIEQIGGYERRADRIERESEEGTEEAEE